MDADMKRIAGAALALTLAHPVAAQQAADRAPTVQKYCVTCHNERASPVVLALDGMDYAKSAGGRRGLEKIDQETARRHDAGRKAHSSRTPRRAARWSAG